MAIIKPIVILTICIFTALLAYAFAANNYGMGSFLICAMGIFWIVTCHYKWSALLTLVFYVAIITTAVGIYLGIAPLLMIISAIAALTTWELDHYRRYLLSVDRLVAEATLIRRYAFRLAFLVAIGLIISIIALSIHLTLSLFPIMLLVGALIFGIYQITKLTSS
jgi:hypothetical protein